METVEIDRQFPESDETIKNWVLKIIRQQVFMLSLDSYKIISLTMSSHIYSLYNDLKSHFYFDIENSSDMKYNDNLETEYMFDFLVKTDKGDFYYVVNRNIKKERDSYINSVLNS